MIPRFETLGEKKLAGRHLTMSLAHDRTFELFRSFMPAKKEITNALTADIYCMQIHPPGYNFVNFDLHAPFEKWAAVEVEDFDHLPAGMDIYLLKGGLYAVFLHKGPASDGETTFRYIFLEWLPASAYELDHREHFEILGAKYKNNDPGSEEEVWIPVKTKG